MFEVKEKPRLVEKAFLLAVIVREDERDQAESLLDELDELVSNLGIQVSQKKVVRVRKTFARYLLGTGKLAEVLDEVKAAGCDVIIFDNELSPSQQRNWEAESNVLVIDRQEIILDVFAARAQTKEAVLQVKLARLEYSLPRLRRAWTHLGRQRGGGVTQRGEGEAQIELDQRMVRDQITATKKEIKQVAKTRKTSRKRRLRIPLPTVALVGYTNAGKSTLLNRVCGSDVLSADKLFATLDPTSRQAQLPTGKRIILTDTVGFIRKLPHRLVEAFKATLEEVVEADLLIHVTDLSHPQVDEQIKAVNTVLEEIKAHEKPCMMVFNKIDQVESSGIIEHYLETHGPAVAISAKSQQGFDSFLAELGTQLRPIRQFLELKIPQEKTQVMARLYEVGQVEDRRFEGNDAFFIVRIPPQCHHEFEPYLLKDLEIASND